MTNENRYSRNVFRSGEIYTVEIADGEIIANGKKLGVVTSIFEEVFEKCTFYKDMLIEKGILEKEKTQEELNEELKDTVKKANEMLVEMGNLIKSQKQEIEELKQKQNHNFNQHQNGGKNNVK